MSLKAQQDFLNDVFYAQLFVLKSKLSIALSMLKGGTVIDRNRKLISYKEGKLRNNLRKAIKVGDSGYPEQSGSGTKQRQ